MQRIIRKVGNVDVPTITMAQVQTATVVRLPFHLCTGPVFQVADPHDPQLTLWLRNKISVPHGSDIHEEIAILNTHCNSSEVGYPTGMFTDAMILNATPTLRAGEFQAVKDEKVASIRCASLRNPGFRFLNEVIAAHQMVRLGPYVSGLGAAWPAMLAEREIYGRVLVEVVVITQPDYQIREQDIIALFNDIDQLPLKLPSFRDGDLKDYSIEQLEKLTEGVRKLRAHAFYELKTNAVAAMLAGDSAVALVLSCAALEGAHGAFLRLTLQDEIPGDPGNFHEFMDKLLREQGFYALVQRSVRELMEGGERPSKEELDQCLFGVTIRNAIMHATVKKSGKYKMRELTPSEIQKGYGGIMAVYFAFERAVEVRENRVSE